MIGARHLRLPRTTPGRAVALVVALAVVASVTYLAWPRPAAVGTPTASGTPAAAANPPRVPIAVSVSQADDIAVRAGSPTTISAHTLGEAPITALELWAGEELVGIHASSRPGPAFSAQWRWTPADPGDAVLVARAIDAMGRVRQSNALRLEVLPGDAADAAGPATLAQDVTTPTLPLAVPAVEAAVDGCTVKVVASSLDAAGVALYHLPPAGMAFLRVAAVPASGSSAALEAPSGGGTSMLVVGAFDDTVEVLSPPITVDVPDACDPGGWSGTVRLDDGVLVGGAPVDRTYLYLQHGDAPAVRVPAEPGTFVEAVDGVVDFGGTVPLADGGAPISIEAWGWRGEELVMIGTGTWSPPKAAPGTAIGVSPSFSGPGAGTGIITTLRAITTTTVPGGSCAKEFCTVEVPVGQDNIVWPTHGPSPERLLRWSTHMPGVTSVVWQILPYAPPKSADLVPPFVIDQGVITVTPGESGGDFTIDFADYLGDQPATTSTLTEHGTATVAAALSPIFDPGSILPPPTPTPNGSRGSGSGAVGAIEQSLLGLGAFAGTFYVRVVPMLGSTPTIASNPVRFDVVPPVQTQLQVPPSVGANAKAYEIVDLSVSLPRPADPKYSRCAVVTGFEDWYTPPPIHDTYAIGTVKCPPAPDDGGGLLGFVEDAFEAFVEFVEDVWQGITEGYAWIQDQVVKLVLATVPCQQIADDAVCETLARTGLAIALASLGVPPTIPDFGTVMAGLKGDLREMALAAASQLPGVTEACGLSEAGAAVTDDVVTCRQMIDQAIDEAIEYAESEVSAAAGKASGHAWPGVIFAPDPRGVYQVPSVTVTLRRTADAVLPAYCVLNASMSSTVAQHTWKELKGGKVVETHGTVKGEAFLPQAQWIPQVGPGETITRTIYLSEPAAGWFESPDSREYWQFYEGHFNVNRAWVLLREGAVLDFTLSGNCSPTVHDGPHELEFSAWK